MLFKLRLFNIFFICGMNLFIHTVFIHCFLFTTLLLSAFLRFSLFRADDWEARIYCHERDVPGSFSVPAFYGRGWKLSLLSTARFPFKDPLQSARTRHALSLRASVLRYFSPTADGTPTGAPRLPQTELKLQYKMEL